MKAKAQRKGKGKAGKQTHRDKLQKFKDAVNHFLQSKGGFDENGSDQRGLFAKKKSRKELRREKRKSKKAKKKRHYMGQSVQNPGEEPAPNTPAEEEEKTQKPALKVTGNLTNTAQKQQKTNKDNEEETTKRKVHFSEDLPKERNRSSLKESRKRSLLEANIEEDKEIKRLEKRLGLNKRKNKQSMPQSFTNDGLDYILGILEPGASAAGLYESDEEMDLDKAKDDFDVLDKDSDGPESDDENKDDSEDEGDTDEEEGAGEDDAQMEEEEDVEDENQIEDEVEGEQEEEDTDASEENDDGEEVDSEQKTPESQEPVCYSKSGYYILLLFKFNSP